MCQRAFVKQVILDFLKVYETNRVPGRLSLFFVTTFSENEGAIPIKGVSPVGASKADGVVWACGKAGESCGKVGDNCGILCGILGQNLSAK